MHPTSSGTSDLWPAAGVFSPAAVWDVAAGKSVSPLSQGFGDRTLARWG